MVAPNDNVKNRKRCLHHNNINMAILCSIQNEAVLKQDWVQVRPRISQKFGLNPQIYKRFGMKGHNGIDYGVPEGTPVFAGIDGTVRVKDSGDQGYGLHIKIRNGDKACELVLGHLSKVLVVDGQRVNVGDKIALSGNTGFSTGPHVHEGYRLLKPGKKDLFLWEVLNYNNGFKGYFDHLEFIINWKGGFIKSSL